MYATVEDLVCRFGSKEIAKRADDGRGLIEDFDNPDLTILEIQQRIQCALDDSCALINGMLACCFDLKCVKDAMDDGETFGRITLWQSHIARYYLHEDISLKNCDHIVAINYEDVMRQIEKLCDCGCLVSDQGTVCDKKCKTFIAVAKRKSCLPKPCSDLKSKCCSCNKSGCKGC